MRFPKEIRYLLAAPQGILFHNTDDLIEAIDGRKVVTVGDVSTKTLLERGIEPLVAIVDGKTRREVRVNLKFLRSFVVVRNPPGFVCVEAAKAIERALKEDLWVLVEGEEDLLAIPALMLASDGTIIIYGQPGAGAVYLEANEKTKRYFRTILEFSEGDGKEELLKLLDRH
ncbi:hypothetical protein EYM_05595 [Ignicoccus islandicus DSM 13165]|uniref:GTP-dependent dephospho-CoA kinase n=1 Tax=Ignicoccus islandicus DSM 13165 TaxID=940295 RepID=A0A0U2M9W2_9CREN|nr:GTP-dependent dephospho-CoA kinase family protein [Ignicoccus islandicus]ALU11869.1 hypothetical protein EYM_05595 [Ignicoccus islandicus DSM 13165]